VQSSTLRLVRYCYCLSCDSFAVVADSEAAGAAAGAVGGNLESKVMVILHHSVVPAVVLVVEDEMLLRMRAVDMVEDAGFTSIEAVDADEAVAILESRSDIALVFTDIQMPGSMDGLKLAELVHDRWPPIRIILVSGQLKPANIDIPAGSRFFRKPLEAEVMMAQMRSMIT
jgi:CheY-like chemotaxis protein